MNLYEIRGSAVNVYITADEMISRLACNTIFFIDMQAYLAVRIKFHVRSN